MDSRFRGNDDNGCFPTFYEFVNFLILQSTILYVNIFSLFFFASFAGVPAAPLRETFLVPSFWFHECGITVLLRPACPG